MLSYIIMLVKLIKDTHKLDLKELRQLYNHIRSILPPRQSYINKSRLNAAVRGVKKAEKVTVYTGMPTSPIKTKLIVFM